MERLEALVIPAGAEVRGRIVAPGRVEIWGRLEGELDAEDVRIAQGAEVVARITAENIDIFGSLIGVADASRSIVVHAGACASGRLSAPSVEISPGSLVDRPPGESAGAAAPRAAVDLRDDDGRGRQAGADVRADASDVGNGPGGAPASVLDDGPGDDDGRAISGEFDTEKTQRFEPGVAVLARVRPRAATPPPTLPPSAPATPPRRPPTAPRPPTRARLSLKPRRGP